MLSLNNGIYQHQTVTTHLVQDMNILQMSAMELEEYLGKLSLENPVIELDEDEKDRAKAQMEFQRKQDWLASTDRQNRVYYQNDRDDGSPENYWKDETAEEDLASYLKNQLLLAEYSKTQWEIVDYLILSLDSRGYCQEDLSAVAAHKGVPTETVEALLRDIQALDPAGVGARSLEECLDLQVRRYHPESVLTRRIIREHLPEVAKNHLSDIARKLGVSLSAVTECCAEIKSLNPKPGNAFSGREQLRYITPDALVLQSADGFEVLINEHQYPSFQISSYYRHLEQTTDDQEAREYLRDKIQQANRLTDSISMRQRNLSRVLDFLVERQEDFFRYGPGHKRPLKLSDIAMEFQMHESTVSRTLRSKYLQCSWGVYPLSYFLTGISTVSQADGEEQTQEHVKLAISEIVRAENKKKPLSDEAIRTKLQEQFGIGIARRTVNKYRQELNIPDKSGRKDWSL